MHLYICLFRKYNNQLKIAALRYRQGNDFWTGPLSTIPGTGNLNIGTLDYGPAEIEPDDCIKYDEFYITTRAEVEMFNSWYECTQDPDCDPNVDFPNYDIPSSILTWPAHGDLFEKNYSCLSQNLNSIYSPKFFRFQKLILILFCRNSICLRHRY